MLNYRLELWVYRSLFITFVLYVGIFIIMKGEIKIKETEASQKVHCSQDHFLGEKIDNKYVCDFITNY